MHSSSDKQGKRRAKRRVNDMPYEPYATYEYYCDAYKGTVIPWMSWTGPLNRPAATLSP